MAWNISTAKRRALVALQLRDKKGRWIEMGGGVKWYSSRLKKNVAGTVVGTKGENALVRMNKDSDANESLVQVAAHNTEVIESKASIPTGDGKSSLDTPEFETPEAVGTDSKETYTVTNTPDGNIYVSRNDGSELYSPARELQVGDELVALDGADPTKPFSIGRSWVTKKAERLNNEGPKFGKVVSISGDRYAVVQMAGGHTVIGRDGEETDTVTVGLSNRIIRATPGLRDALRESMGEDTFAEWDTADDTEITDEDLANSDHVGREVPEDQLDAPPAPRDATPQAPEEAPAEEAPKEAITSFRVSDRVASEIQFAIETQEASDNDPGLRLDGNRVEVYDLDKAIFAIDGPLGVLDDNIGDRSLPFESGDPAYRTANDRNNAKKLQDGLNRLRSRLVELKGEEAKTSEDAVSPEPTDEVPSFDPKSTAQGLTSLQKAMIIAMRDLGWNSNSSDIRTGAVRNSLQQKGLIRSGRAGEPSFVITDEGKSVADELSPKNEEAPNAPEESAPVAETEAPAEPSTPEEPAAEVPTAVPTPENEIVDGVSRVAQDMEDIQDSSLAGDELRAALEEATYSFTGNDGKEYTVSGNPEGDGEYSYNVTDAEGKDVGNWNAGSYDSPEEIANDIIGTVNRGSKTESQSENIPSEESSAPQPSYNENGLTEDEQRSADAYVRMANREYDNFNDAAGDRYRGLADELFKKGEERNASGESEAPQEEVPAPSAPEEAAPETEGATEPVNEAPESAQDTPETTQESLASIFVGNNAASRMLREAIDSSSEDTGLRMSSDGNIEVTDFDKGLVTARDVLLDSQANSGTSRNSQITANQRTRALSGVVRRIEDKQNEYNASSPEEAPTPASPDEP